MFSSWLRHSTYTLLILASLTLLPHQSIAEEDDSFYIPLSPPKVTSDPTAQLFSTLNNDEPVQSEVNLIHVTSDAMPGYGDFKMAVDEANKILQLRYYPSDNEKQLFSLEQLKTGIVLLRQSNLDVVTIKSNSFNALSGGPIDLIYLTNGIWKSYGTFNMEMVLSGNHWVMRTKQGSEIIEFTSLFFKKKELLGKVIGISEVLIK